MELQYSTVQYCMDSGFLLLCTILHYSTVSRGMPDLSLSWGHLGHIIRYAFEWTGTECHGILRYGKIYEYSLFVCLFVNGSRASSRERPHPLRRLARRLAAGAQDDCRPPCYECFAGTHSIAPRRRALVQRTRAVVTPCQAEKVAGVQLKVSDAPPALL